MCAYIFTVTHTIYTLSCSTRLNREREKHSLCVTQHNYFSLTFIVSISLRLRGERPNMAGSDAAALLAVGCVAVGGACRWNSSTLR